MPATKPRAAPKMAPPSPKRGSLPPKRTPAPPKPPTADAGASGYGAPLPMGTGGATHPPIGVGLWALGRWYPEDEERTRAVLARALEERVPWIDTAEVYGGGRSERMLGDALAAPRPAGVDRPFITTKLSWEHLRTSQVRPSLLGSRRRLGLDRIDLYLVHAPDPHVPVRETMEALEALWKEGQIAAIGVSNFSVEELEAAQAALSGTTLVANQVRFNLFERDEADPVLEYCRAHKIVVEAYSPTARGLLAGRYLTGKGPGKGDVRAGRGIFDPELFPTYQARARKLQALAEEEGVPLLALALHGLRRAGAAPVLGASRVAQLDEALAAWRTRPSEKALARAEAIGRGDDD
jgi:aryl-alcohol dehydrogenase-like predicted oxidoreductase